MREIWAGGRFEEGRGASVLKDTSYADSEGGGGAAGRVSMGLMQATPGEMKSFCGGD